MKIRIHCPHCPAHIDAAWLPGDPAVLRCPRCGKDISLNVSDLMRERNMIDRCPACASGELYIRKDFPQGLGLAIVVVAAVGSFWFLKSNWFIAWGFLLAAVAADVVLYMAVGFVTCCYRCKAEYRGVQRNSTHATFDLPTAEKYS